MKRVGILTFHRAHNYGAVLQCFALKETIRQMGYDVQVIDYRQPQIENSYRYHYIFDKKESNGFGALLYLLRQQLANIYHFYLYIRKRYYYTTFQKSYLSLSCRCNRSSIPTYDCYVIGSDMLWDSRCLNGQYDDVYFYKPSTTTSLENYGNNDANIKMTIDQKTNKVSLSMPPISYIWIKGKDTQWNPVEDNDQLDWDSDNNNGEINVLAIVLITIGSVIFLVAVGIVIFFVIKKKKNENLEDKVNKFNENDDDNEGNKVGKFFSNIWNKATNCCKKSS